MVPGTFAALRADHAPKNGSAGSINGGIPALAVELGGLQAEALEVRVRVLLEPWLRFSTRKS
eukprot:351435-Rhodomonas_salina.4